MARGGKRPGAGRPKKPPPEGLAEAVASLVGGKVSMLGASAAVALAGLDETGGQFEALDFFRAIYRNPHVNLETRAAAAKAVLAYEAPKPVAAKASDAPEAAPLRAVSAAAETLNAKLSALAKRGSAASADGDADGDREGGPSLRLAEVAPT